MSSTTFGILHVTDLHAGQRAHDLYYPHMRQGFLEDLDYSFEKSGPWDLVIFSGDLTFSGKQSEFEIVNKFLNDLYERLNKLGSGNAVFLAVPGNHDLRRPPDDTNSTVVSLASLSERSGLSPKVAEKIWDRILDDPHSEYRKTIKAAFDDYAEWWEPRAVQAEKILKPFRRGLLPGEFAATFRKGGCQLGIVGLNSTFLQLTDGNFQGKLQIHLKQSNQLMMPDDDQDWLRKVDAAVLITHQPPDWLWKINREGWFEPLIAKSGRFAAHMCGHMHIANNETSSRGGFAARRIFLGPSLLALEPTTQDLEHFWGYQALRITVKEVETGSVRCWPRKVKTKTQDNDWKFVRDDSFNLDDDGGTPEKSGYFDRPNWKESKPPSPEVAQFREKQPLDLSDAKELGEQAAFGGDDVFFFGEEGAGKTTALIACLAKAVELGKKRAFINFMEFDEFEDGPDFWLGIANAIFHELKADANLQPPAEILRLSDLTRYLFDKVLPVAYPLVIGFDEVGRLRRRPIENRFYRMLRAWHDKDRVHFGNQSRLQIVLCGKEPLTELADENDKGSRRIYLTNVGLDLMKKNSAKNSHQLDDEA